MKIIPAIDLIDGKCVRLTQGDYGQKKVYNENPLEVAKWFEDAGLKFLHLVDLDGAKAGKVVNWAVVEALTSKTSLSVDFGGGIKTSDEVSRLLSAGVKQVNLGSIAVKSKELVFGWIDQFGADQIILSADVKDELVQISGWQENAALRIDDFVQTYLANGIKTVTCTDIATDGMLSGPNVSLYKKLIARFPTIQWIASGGVSDISDVNELKSTGVSGVIIGKAIYEGKISLDQLSNI
ncbi:MAG TPA: 1-(5-phosphoribosyl)-5-[(5-phosphoribosylamino)methylideneamino]imidazole-4-carboxamide isomerase [Chryseosolibacter sp.]